MKEYQKIEKVERVPYADELIVPCFEALRELGNSATVAEIYSNVIEKLKLSDAILSVMHTENRNLTRVEYNLAWARTYLKKYGAINNPTRGVWEIVHEFKEKNITREEVLSKLGVPQNRKDMIEQKHNVITSYITKDDIPDKDKPWIKELEQVLSQMNPNSLDDIPDEDKPWIKELEQVLSQMNPYSFEELTQEILRKTGLDSVTVTKKSGDGGVDGYGILKVNGIISFNLAFQCKRYKGAVGAPEIRDFRGSITSDIEKALMITTGTYTEAAKKEALCAGKIKIDLIDGISLIKKIIELNIGVKEEKIIIVDKNYFLK